MALRLTLLNQDTSQHAMWSHPSGHSEILSCFVVRENSTFISQKLKKSPKKLQKPLGLMWRPHAGPLYITLNYGHYQGCLMIFGVGSWESKWFLVVVGLKRLFSCLRTWTKGSTSFQDTIQWSIKLFIRMLTTSSPSPKCIECYVTWPSLMGYLST